MRTLGGGGGVGVGLGIRFARVLVRGLTRGGRRVCYRHRPRPPRRRLDVLRAIATG